jgi:hypothetical protein
MVLDRFKCYYVTAQEYDKWLERLIDESDYGDNFILYEDARAAFPHSICKEVGIVYSSVALN